MIDYPLIINLITFETLHSFVTLYFRMMYKAILLLSLAARARPPGTAGSNTPWLEPPFKHSQSSTPNNLTGGIIRAYGAPTCNKTLPTALAADAEKLLATVTLPKGECEAGQFNLCGE